MCQIISDTITALIYIDFIFLHTKHINGCYIIGEKKIRLLLFETFASCFGAFLGFSEVGSLIN